jgi:hypothetical protein
MRGFNTYLRFYRGRAETLTGIYIITNPKNWGQARGLTSVRKFLCQKKKY